MSWLARSIANSLRIDDDDEDDDDHTTTTTTPNPSHTQYVHEQHREAQEEEEEENRSDTQGRGVKEDLSELRETLTRQLWGVASFLAPPPPPPPPLPPHHRRRDCSVSDRNRWESSGQSGSGDVSEEDASDSVGDSGIRSDFVDIDERFRDGISNFSNFPPIGSEGQIGGAVGITDEVLAFARNIAHHPETWLDFPLSEEEDIDDFDMSDAQRKHALAVEYLAPRLAALRIELCPAHMSEGYFWKVYFLLLYSRLNKHDAEVLSTPQIVAARAMWMQELQKRTKLESDWFGSTLYSKESANSLLKDFDPALSYDAPSGRMSHRTFAFEPRTYPATMEVETEKHPVVSTEIQIIDKSVIEEEPVLKNRDNEFVAGPSYKVPVHDYDDDGDDWLEENSELDGYCGTSFLVGNEEDVSFSDLEDDDDCTMPIKSKIVSEGLDASTKTS